MCNTVTKCFPPDQRTNSIKTIICMNFLCCRVTLISLDWNKSRKFEMKGDKVMRGYSYRVRDYITSRHEILTEQQIAFTTLIGFSDEQKRKSSLCRNADRKEQVQSESKWDSRDLKKCDTHLCKWTVGCWMLSLHTKQGHFRGLSDFSSFEKETFGNCFIPPKLICSYT